MIATTVTQAQETAIPTFKINLDDPPSQGFNEPTKHFAPAIMKLMEFYESLLLPRVNEVFRVSVDYSTWFAQKEKYQELDGIAKALGIETRRIVVVNFVYEYVTFCTSLIARQTDGLIMHMRMLDFAAPALSKNATYMAQFYRGGQPVYEAVMVGGTAFFATGFKKGAFSISQNQRKSAT